MSASNRQRTRLVERSRDYRQPQAQLRRRGDVCVVEGFGLRVGVERGQLLVSDGAGRQRHIRRYSRTAHGLSRLVVIGSTGTVSLEALRWLADLGIRFVHLDRDGRLLTHSAAIGLDEARLRRAQALAADTPAGLEISRYLLGEKLAGQRQLLTRLGNNADLLAGFDGAAERLTIAASVEELVYAERDAALAYWTGWRTVQLRFRPADAGRVTEHWLRFGQRVSPTGAPRLAVNPANALLNYLYALVEAETRIGCLTAGLDPALGLVHADYRGRDSFALDLMEAVRPQVDAYVLDLIQGRVFRASDFHETRKGNCRILAPLNHQLADTVTHWGTVVAPVVEQVARVLTNSSPASTERLPTPLTGQNRLDGREPLRRRPPRQQLITPPKPTPTCRRCGNPLPRSGRTYCDQCLPHYQREQYAEAFHGSGLRAIENAKQHGNDPTHGDTAAVRRAETNVQRKREAREWEERHGELVDLSAFEREILPAIQGVPLSRLQRATGLSLRYVSLIRRGEKTPHPRHWQGLVDVAEQQDRL